MSAKGLVLGLTLGLALGLSTAVSADVVYTFQSTAAPTATTAPTSTATPTPTTTNTPIPLPLSLTNGGTGVDLSALVLNGISKTGLTNNSAANFLAIPATANTSNGAWIIGCASDTDGTDFLLKCAQGSFQCANKAGTMSSAGITGGAQITSGVGTGGATGTVTLVISTGTAKCDVSVNSATSLASHTIIWRYFVIGLGGQSVTPE